MHKTSNPRARRVAAAGALAAGFALLPVGLAQAQGLTVLPVDI